MQTFGQMGVVTNQGVFWMLQHFAPTLDRFTILLSLYAIIIISSLDDVRVTWSIYLEAVLEILLL